MSEDRKWVEMREVSKLECLGGNIVVNGEAKNYDFQANCREPSESGCRTTFKRFIQFQKKNRSLKPALVPT